MMKKIIVPVLIGAVIGIVGYLAYDRMTGGTGKSTEATLEQQAKKDQDTIAALQEKVVSLEETLEKELRECDIYDCNDCGNIICTNCEYSYEESINNNDNNEN